MLPKSDLLRLIRENVHHPATARELIRPTFRNWFRPHYPYVYASFRCVKGIG